MTHNIRMLNNIEKTICLSLLDGDLEREVGDKLPSKEVIEREQNYIKIVKALDKNLGDAVEKARGGNRYISVKKYKLFVELVSVAADNSSTIVWPQDVPRPQPNNSEAT